MASFTPDHLRLKRDKFFPGFALTYVNNDPAPALKRGTVYRPTFQQPRWKRAL
jgi:hypothetical protein